MISHAAAGLILMALLVGGCTTGNERDSLGNFTPGNSVKLHEYVDRGEPPPPKSDGVSTTSLSRESWKVTTVLVPVDGLASRPTYARTYIWTDETTRQRREQPSALTALELDGSTRWQQVGEAAASAPLAVWDGVRMVAWDFLADPFWREKIRPTLQPYARADPATPRLSWLPAVQPAEELYPVPSPPVSKITSSDPSDSAMPASGKLAKPTTVPPAAERNLDRTPQAPQNLQPGQPEAGKPIVPIEGPKKEPQEAFDEPKGT